MGPVIRILLADDEADMLEDLHDMLVYQKNLDYQIQVVAMATHGAEALEMSERYRPDIAILDLEMPGLDGLATAKAMHRSPPSPKVLIYSCLYDRLSMQEALESNIRGYVLKSRSQLLLSAIDEVFNGGFRFDSQVFHEMYSRSLKGDGVKWLCSLTARERQVLKLFCAGRTQKLIATELLISSETVKTYLSQIRKKSGCVNLAELKVKAVKLPLFIFE